MFLNVTKKYQGHKDYLTLLLNSIERVNLKIIQSSSLPSIGLTLSYVGIFLT
jgi:hypothetical protein